VCVQKEKGTGKCTAPGINEKGEYEEHSWEKKKKAVGPGEKASSAYFGQTGRGAQLSAVNTTMTAYGASSNGRRESSHRPE